MNTIKDILIFITSAFLHYMILCAVFGKLPNDAFLSEHIIVIVASLVYTAHFKMQRKK